MQKSLDISSQIFDPTWKIHSMPCESIKFMQLQSRIMCFKSNAGHVGVGVTLVPLIEYTWFTLSLDEVFFKMFKLKLALYFVLPKKTKFSFKLACCLLNLFNAVPHNFLNSFRQHPFGLFARLIFFSTLVLSSCTSTGFMSTIFTSLYLKFSTLA